MSARFVNIDRETPLLLPANLREWLPENHVVHFIVEAVEQLDTRGFKVNHKGSGSAQYPPPMMVSLLLYCYATGRMSSRVIEDATYTDVAVRYICGNRAHPDHSVICRFRTENREEVKDIFTKVLVMAQTLGYLKRLGRISVEGTKPQAKAGAPPGGSDKQAGAGAVIGEAEREVGELLAKAEHADHRPLASGLRLPEALQGREDRRAALERAKGEMEKRYEEARREREAEGETRGEGPEPGDSVGK